MMWNGLQLFSRICAVPRSMQYSGPMLQHIRSKDRQDRQQTTGPSAEHAHANIDPRPRQEPPPEEGFLERSTKPSLCIRPAQHRLVMHALSF
jgi:hypothetical protein